MNVYPRVFAFSLLIGAGMVMGAATAISATQQMGTSPGARNSSPSLIMEVRQAIAKNDVALGNAEIQEYQVQHGITPEMLEALSWMARGALSAQDYSQAQAYAEKTHKLALEQLTKRSLDEERHLPIALGAAIEVQGQVMAAQNQRGEAIAFLQEQLRQYYSTSIRTRIQKNINLLTLEGKPAPALQENEYLGAKPAKLSTFAGKPVLLFFWAHWCGDCKAEVPILARLEGEYHGRLALIGPTQRYGFVAKAKEASPAEELNYIEQIREQYYASLADMPVPVGEETFKVYGVSTTPTLVLIDGKGILRMYHPGQMTYQQLKSAIDKILAST